MKPLKSYLPDPSNDQPSTLVQARVDRTTVDQVKVLMRSCKLTWHDVIQASLEHFVDELGTDPAAKKKKKGKFLRRCPVCRFDRFYTGVVCPGCTKLGYKVQSNGKIRRNG